MLSVIRHVEYRELVALWRLGNILENWQHFVDDTQGFVGKLLKMFEQFGLEKQSKTNIESEGRAKISWSKRGNCTPNKKKYLENLFIIKSLYELDFKENEKSNVEIKIIKLLFLTFML